MAKKTLAAQLRGATALAASATRGVTNIVEAMHHTIGAGPAVLGRPLEKVNKWLSAPAYGAVRAVTNIVGAGLDQAIAQLEPLINHGGVEQGAVLAALNGIIGDYLAETHNPLAIEMSLCADGRPLVLEREALRARVVPHASHLVVLIHGSSMNDAQWLRRGHNHGQSLARDAGLMPLYLRYNSGLHISKNGRALAQLLETLVREWPQPVQSLTLLGHSMGGLLARSALAQVHSAGLTWRGLPLTLVTLGSPHHGSSLERMGNWADVLLKVSRYSAPLASLGHLRSAGVTDLRYGNVLDEDWANRGRFEPGPDARTPLPLPEGVRCFAVAGTKSLKRGARMASDGLVSVDSALGHHEFEDHALGFEEWVAPATSHLDLLSSRAVYEKILEWVAPTAGLRGSSA